MEGNQMISAETGPPSGFNRPFCALLIAGTLLSPHVKAGICSPPSVEMVATFYVEKTLRGKVLDDAGKGLPGVSVCKSSAKSGQV